MTREEKCKLAIEKGFTYDEITVKVFSPYNKEVLGKSNNYIVLSIWDKKLYRLYSHQFAYYIKYNKIIDCIDHINGDRSDNRIDNLREVTHQQNGFNAKAKGYCFHKKSNKFMSKITLNGKAIYLGIFNTEEEARQAYLDAKKKYHIIN